MQRVYISSAAEELSKRLMSLPADEQAVALCTDAGRELKQSVMSTFIKFRRMVRKQAQTEAAAADHVRRVRRKLKKLEAGKWSFLDVEKSLHCRHLLADLTQTRDEVLDGVQMAGEILMTLAPMVEAVIGREKALDLMNVNLSDRKYLLDADPVVNLLRTGFEDSASQSKSNRGGLRPMQACVLRALRAPRKAQPVEAPPEMFAFYEEEIAAYRKQAEEAIAELDTVAMAERNLKNRTVEAIQPLTVRRIAVLECMFALWDELRPILANRAKLFSLEQKLHILRADPEKLHRITETRPPEGVSLLELVGWWQIERPVAGDSQGAIFTLGLLSNTTEFRETLEFCRALLAGDQDQMFATAAATRGAVFHPAHETLQ